MLVRGDALRLPLRDASVDLIVTSPPYFALRSYQDSCPTCGGVAGKALTPPSDKSTLRGNGHVGGGPKYKRDGATANPDCSDCHGTGRGHYHGQIGSEPTPAAFLDALWAATAEMVRVLKPSGSLFVNLGDKYVHGGRSRVRGPAEAVEFKGAGLGTTKGWNHTDAHIGADIAGMPAKSLMGLPWRYAIGCIDQLNLILRAELIWSKPNGLPESVQDRVRRSHEQWFHLTREPRYYSAVDEIREERTGNDAQSAPEFVTVDSNNGDRHRTMRRDPAMFNPLGKLPGSVWTIPSEPLHVPDWLNVDHFAAFPQEWPRRLILGWSPPGVCVECGEGRRPQVEHDTPDDLGPRVPERLGQRQGNGPTGNGLNVQPSRITGYVCACGTWETERVQVPQVGTIGTDREGEMVWVDRRRYIPPNPVPPTTPAVILDPFAGTGTVPMVARALGRTGIGVDLSADYLRLARWRITSGSSKTVARTNAERQGALVFEGAS